MVNLSLEAPHSAPHRSHRVFPKLLAFGFIALISGAGGFFLGRRTAGRTPSEVVPLPAALSSGNPQPVGAAPANVPPTSTVTPTSAVAALPSSGPGTAALSSQPAPGSAPVPPGLKRLAATLQGPLEQNIIAALPAEDRGFGEELTQIVNRLLIWHLHVSRDGRKGDRIELLYQPPTAEQRGPVVEALRYTSQKLGRTFEAIHYRPEGSPFARYYQSDGSELEERLIDGPIGEYEQVTSILSDGRRHKGVDFKTPVGSPVLAPFAGTVVRRNWHFSANGNCLEIVDSVSGRHAIFLHLESVPKELGPGVKVTKGQLIAHSGNSGHSTAPHLHYQIESADGRILDPFTVHKTHRLSLPGGAKASFDRERARLEELLTKGY